MCYAPFFFLVFTHPKSQQTKLALLICEISWLIFSKVPPEQRHVFEKILNENIVATLTDMGKKKMSVNEIIPYFNISDTSVLAMSHGESEIMSAWHEITE